jgi:hypothetical protein
MIRLDAEESIRNNLFGREIAAEEAEIELLKLDQILITDATKVKDFSELVSKETSKQ